MFLSCFFHLLKSQLPTRKIAAPKRNYGRTKNGLACRTKNGLAGGQRRFSYTNFVQDSQKYNIIILYFHNQYSSQLRWAWSAAKIPVPFASGSPPTLSSVAMPI